MYSLNYMCMHLYINGSQIKIDDTATLANSHVFTMINILKDAQERKKRNAKKTKYMHIRKTQSLKRHNVINILNTWDPSNYNGDSFADINARTAKAKVRIYKR